MLAVACRPDGEEVAVATLDGQISFWSVQAARQVKSVDGRKDLGAGRSVMDKISAQSSAFGKYGQYETDCLCLKVEKLFLLRPAFGRHAVGMLPVTRSLLVRRRQVLHEFVLHGRRPVRAGGRPVALRLYLSRGPAGERTGYRGNKLFCSAVTSILEY